MEVIRIEKVIDEIEKIEAAIDKAESLVQIKELMRQLCKATASIAYYTPEKGY